MAPIPQRPGVASVYRRALGSIERRIALPNVNPALYQVLGILLSVLYLYLAATWGKALVVAAILVLDWLDGATARQHRRIIRAGYIADVMIDRVSEALIFVAESGTRLGQLFFLATLLNAGLSYYSARTGKHASLPLRYVFLMVLIARMLLA